jgi:hypothetical protein
MRLGSAMQQQVLAKEKKQLRSVILPAITNKDYRVLRLGISRETAIKAPKQLR